LIYQRFGVAGIRIQVTASNVALVAPTTTVVVLYAFAVARVKDTLSIAAGIDRAIDVIVASHGCPGTATVSIADVVQSTGVTVLADCICRQVGIGAYTRGRVAHVLSAGIVVRAVLIVAGTLAAHLTSIVFGAQIAVVTGVRRIQRVRTSLGIGIAHVVGALVGIVAVGVFGALAIRCVMLTGAAVRVAGINGAFALIIAVFSCALAKPVGLASIVLGARVAVVTNVGLVDLVDTIAVRRIARVVGALVAVVAFFLCPRATPVDLAGIVFSTQV